jgi:hypothetical protein
VLRLLFAIAIIVAPASPALTRPALGAPIGVRVPARADVQPRFENDTWFLAIELLTDDGAPLPLAPLTLTVADFRPVALTTDGQGRAVWRIPARSGRGPSPSLQWTVTFGGTSAAAPIETSGTVELARLPTRMHLVADASTIDLASPPLRFAIRLETAEATPTAVSAADIRFRIDDGPAQSGRTDTAGRVVFVIHPAHLNATGPSPAPLVVEARFEGDAIHAPARAEIAVMRHVVSRVTLRVAREGDATAGRLRFSGRVSHEFGAWADAAVRVMVSTATGREILAIPSLSGANGVWNAAIPLDALRATGEPRVMVTAHAAPHGSLRPAEAPALLLEVPRIPGRSALVPLLLLAALLVVVRFADGARRKALSSRLMAWSRAVRDGLARLVHGWRRRFGPAGTRVGPSAVPGLVPASGTGRRRSAVAVRFIDQDTGVSLQVQVSACLAGDNGSEVRVERAEVRDFEFESRTAGVCHLTIDGPGLVPVSLAVRLPHDGAWDGATVTLRRIERRIREIHEQAATRLGHPQRWGRDTPRDLVRHANASSASLQALVATVEAAYFGPIPPDRIALDRAERLHAELERGAGDAPSRSEADA